MRSLVAGVTTLLIVLVVPASAGARISEFAIPTPNGGPVDITAGPDGALWFTEAGSNAIGRITTTGSISQFPLPPLPGFTTSDPSGIAAGPDGALWFTETIGNKIGRITTTGDLTEFPLPTCCNSPSGIAAGPDGALWFTENGANRIGRITTTGAISEFQIPNDCCGPADITAGPDGALWFTEFGADIREVGRITTTGSFTLFPIPTLSNPGGIAAGPDGALWFTATGPFNSGEIWRITTTGTFRKFAVPTPANAITAGPGRAHSLWFTAGGDQIGRITTTGRIGEFRLPTANSGPLGITAGPDRALWFTESEADKIGRITPGRAPSEAFLEGTLHTEPPCTPGPGCIQRPRYIFEATSQPRGKNPRGIVSYETGERLGVTVASGSVTCLYLHRNRATVGVNLENQLGGPPPPQGDRGALIFLEDNGPASADKIAVQDLPAGTAPSTCPASPPAGTSLGPAYPGPLDSAEDPGVTITYLPTAAPRD